MDRKLARRPLFWGSAKRDFKQFRPPCRRTWGVALFVVHLGGALPSAKPWKGLGPGVFELVEDHRGSAYRAAYTVRIADCIHVLHAFQKKSKSGIKTPKTDVDLIERRLKAVQERYRANERK
jgi:phage-related protein